MPLQHIDSSSSSTSEDESEYTAESQEEMADNITDTNEETNEPATDANDEEKEVKRDSEVSDDERKSNDGRNSGSDATIPYCDNSGSESVVSSRTCSRASSPCSTRESINQDTRDSVSQDTMFPESSRENSPMIDDHMLRKLCKGPRLKDLPNSRAARNLNSFLFTEDSNSKSSDFAENSNSGIPMFKGKLDLKDILLDENSSSSTPGDNSNSCDMKELFKNSSVNSEGSNSAIKENVHNDYKVGADSVESMHISENESANFPESQTRTSSSNVEQSKLLNDIGVIETSDINTEKTTLDEDSVLTKDNENKENIETCNMSNEQLLLKNANGFISRSDSLMQGKKVENESREEEMASNDKVSMSDNDEKMDVTEEGIEKMADSQFETGLAAQTVDKTIGESDTDIHLQKGTRAFLVENENDDNTSNELETSFKGRTAEAVDSSEMAIDNVPQNSNVKTELSENDFQGSSTSQIQHAQNSESNLVIKQELEETSEKKGFSIVKTEKDVESSEDVEHQTKEAGNDVDSGGKDKVDLNKVKTEITDKELENGGKKEEGGDSPMKDSSTVKSEVNEEDVKEEKKVKEEEEEEEEVVSPNFYQVFYFQFSHQILIPCRFLCHIRLKRILFT